MGNLRSSWIFALTLALGCQIEPGRLPSDSGQGAPVDSGTPDAGRDAGRPPTVDAGPNVIATYPVDMWGQITTFQGVKTGDPAAEAPYDAITGHTNYGAGAAAAPFFEPTLTDAGVLLARRAEVRSQIWSALRSQGGDSSQVPLSWADVTFVAPLTEPQTTTLGTPYVKQRFLFTDPVFGDRVSGIILIPAIAASGATPAVLYNHYHGGEYWVGTYEIDGDSPDPNVSGQAWVFPPHGTFGEYLVDEGYVVLGIDALGFTWRRFDAANRGDTESIDDIWDELGFTQQFQSVAFDGSTGRSRYGVRSFEDLLALKLLQSHPLVDAQRISTMGMSMGCVRSWTLAALVGEQLSAAVALGTFPRWQELAADGIKGAHRNSHFFTGQIDVMKLDTESFLLAASTTNVLAIMGDDPADPQDGQVHPNSPDPSSPGWPSVFAYAQQVAGTLGEHEFRGVSVSGLGHTWSGPLADQAIAFINTHSGRANASCSGIADGLYCGGDQVGGDAKALYRCVGGAATLWQLCAAGCQINPAQTNDACH